MSFFIVLSGLISDISCINEQKSKTDDFSGVIGFLYFLFF